MAIGNAFVAALLEVIYQLLRFYMWILIIGALLSWLIALGIVDPYHRFVRSVATFTTRMTEPVLRPIRRRIPPAGGLDLSPLILILLIGFLQSFIVHLMYAHG